MRRALIAIMALSAAASSFGAGPDKVVPATNEIELWQQVGQQPYEMIWVQREEHPKTLVDFEDLTGWTLELYKGAEGELRRSREQQMWGRYVAKILYSGTRPEGRVIARPPKPIRISQRFDSIELWGYGNRWRGTKDDMTPPADVSVLVLDARGKEFAIPLTDIHWKQWWLIHRKAPAQLLKEMVFPASFSGIEISKGTNKDPRYFFCDSLAFYTEELKPLKFQPQPKRNLKPYRGQIVGTNTGPGTLPFPTREETILPENREKDFQVTVRQVATSQFELRYKGRDATVTYDYRPRRGSLGELTVSVDGGPALRPLEGGGVRFVDTPESRVSEGELISAGVVGEVVEARFRHGSRQVDYNLRLWRKSVVLDVWCDGGEATELSFGRVAGVSQPKPIIVPYITYRTANPRVLMSGGKGKPVFTSVWFDWYRTNASEPYMGAEPQVTADSAEINGGMRYIARTDGLRNNLYERIFITNSPLYEETLPTIANPPSLRQEEGKQVIWTEPEAFVPLETWQKDYQRCRWVRSYGLDKIMQHSHETTWRDEGDSFTMKLQASPQKGGDAMFQWFIKAVNELGWLQGTYTNYTDFCPVNTNWNPDHVQRTTDGEWRRAWPRNYALKPAKAVEFDEYYAKRIKEKFGTKMAYTDVHTAAAPWGYVDYDARVPGAGTFAATFYAYGQLLLNDQKVYGPTQSEGTFQWMYAGLEAGTCAWAGRSPNVFVNLLTHPLDVSFQLMKIHPLQAGYGLSDTYFYLRPLDGNWAGSPKRREYVDLFLATGIAYGNFGWLIMPEEFPDPQIFGIEAMARSYYMMQQLQQQYAFVPPRTIEYADRAGKFLTPAQAHASGAIDDSRLHVVYENGTEVYVNRSSSGVWTVRDREDKAVDLPVSGWLVFNPKNNFHEISATVGGKRIDYVRALEYEFLDGRGQRVQQGNLEAAGSVALRRKSGGVLELIDIYGNDRIAFQARTRGALMAYDPEGKSLGKVELTSPRTGWYEFKPVSGGRMYLLAPLQGSGW